MATAFLFPGQGSQFAGMGADLYESHPAARAVFEAADEVLGFSLTEVMFGGGEAAAERLRQTEITQPALFVHSMAAFAVLEKAGFRPDVAAGHSLGEYSALAAAKAISLADGLRVVRLRGELMARAGDERLGTMAAVLGMDDDVIEGVCREVSAEGEEVVQPANFNSPGQVVISGDRRAVEIAMERLRQRGARRVVPLPVGGAFHSPLMAYAREGLGEALRQLDIRQPVCPVYMNVTARPASSPEEIRPNLLEQLLAPVRWADILRHMHEDGVTGFVEVGAGNVLSGLARRTLGRDVEVRTAGTSDEVASFSV